MVLSTNSGSFPSNSHVSVTFSILLSDLGNSGIWVYLTNRKICNTYLEWCGLFPHVQKEECVVVIMSVVVPIPSLASVSVLQSAVVGGSVEGVVGPL